MKTGQLILQYVEAVAESIGKAVNGYKVIVDKSTVPVGTADRVTEIIKRQTSHDFDVVSNPEFLKQGAAVDDFLKPDRVVIGSNSQRATEIMQELYSPFFAYRKPCNNYGCQVCRDDKICGKFFFSCKKFHTQMKLQIFAKKSELMQRW